MTAGDLGSDLPTDLQALITRAGAALNMEQTELDTGLQALRDLAESAALIRLQQLRGESVTAARLRLDDQAATVLSLAAQGSADVRRDLITVISLNPHSDPLNAALILAGLPPEWGEAPPAAHWPARSVSWGKPIMDSLELTAVAWARLHLAGLTGPFPAPVRALFAQRCSALGAGGQNPWQLSLNSVPDADIDQVADLWSEQKFITGLADMKLRLSSGTDPLPPRLRGLEFSQLPRWAQVELERAEHPSVPVRETLSGGLAPTPAPPMPARWAIEEEDAPEDVVREAERTFTQAAALLAQAWSGQPEQLKNDVARAARDQTHPALLAALHGPMIVTGSQTNLQETPGFTPEEQSDLTRLIWGAWTWIRQTVDSPDASNEWLTTTERTVTPRMRRADLYRCGAPDGPGLAMALFVACGHRYLTARWTIQNALALSTIALQACAWLNTHLTPADRRPDSGGDLDLPWVISPIPQETHFMAHQLRTLMKQAEQEQRERPAIPTTGREP